ncbi:hypothetical protein VTP01DRAFT_10555 [Rhizomucor pusillus]|uniref:uncharacterized protein n=1 Tax=Rhizomucor pusillus TaxID=4840 RepID=UPI003744098D
MVIGSISRTALRNTNITTRSAQQFLRQQCRVRQSLSSAAPSRWLTSAAAAEPGYIERTRPQKREHTPEKEYSETQKKFAIWIGQKFGYFSPRGESQRASVSLYAICAEQAAVHREFFIRVCNLPDNFQTWFSITQLYIWMLMVRLRAEKNGKLLIQELVNRLFEDAEDRIRAHDIKQQRVINNYIKDLLAQFHGGVTAYDEGMCKDDPVLAAALWRNLFAPTSNNAVDLALVVRYVRKQLKELEEFDGNKLNNGFVTFCKPDTKLP